MAHPLHRRRLWPPARSSSGGPSSPSRNSSPGASSRRRLLLGCLLCTLLVLEAGCRNECQQLCDRMEETFRLCGIESSQAELLECRESQARALAGEQAQCAAQTLPAIEQNLSIKSGSSDPCEALLPYAAP